MNAIPSRFARTLSVIRGLLTRGAPQLVSIMIAVFFFLFLTVVLAWAQETINYPGTALGEPQSRFGFSTDRNSPMPATANSLFPVNNPSDNIVNVAGTITGHVFGGIAPKIGVTTHDNKVNITNSNIGTSSTGGNVTGGWALDGDVMKNTVTIDNGAATVRGIVFGGWIRGDGGVMGQGGGKAVQNAVIIKSGTFRNNVYGAYVQTGGGALTNNTVTIENGSLESTDGIIAGAYSALAQNDVTNNAVAITGGTFKGARDTSTGYSIYGGRGQSTSAIIANTVSINGATLLNATIYGGQNISGSGAVILNTVSIGETSATTLTNTAAIYGGYSGSGVATNNGVTLGQYATGNIADLLGGFARYSGDAFSGNTLNLNSLNVRIERAGNFQTVNFGAIGTADIGSLSTTPTGSTLSGVTVKTTGTDVTLGGVIEGSGSLTKDGVGTLILTNNNNRIINSAGVTVQGGTLQVGAGGTSGNLSTPKYTVATGATLAYSRSNEVVYGGPITGGGTLKQDGTGILTLTGDSNSVGAVNIAQGTLQLGDGGASGSIIASAGINIADDAFLVYKRSDNITDTNKITGDGTVVQRGGGTLTLTNTGNTFTGGTEIESGALNIAAFDSLGKTIHSSTSNAGFVTFMGNNNSKNVFISSNVTSLTKPLNNSFRTEKGAGNSNTVTIAPSQMLLIGGNQNSQNGGVFYVAEGTEMNVKNDSFLYLRNNFATEVGGLGSYSNDLYVEDGGTFNLYTNDYTRFESGIYSGGEGSTLNLRTSENAVLNPRIDFINNNGTGANPPIFHMGKTTVTGAVDKGMTLVVGRMLPEDPSDPPLKRTEFENETSFTIQGLAYEVSLTAAALAGDGIIQAGIATALGSGVNLDPADGTITVKNGAVLIPTALDYDPDYGMSVKYGTLTLNAAEVSLTDFGYIYQPNVATAELVDDGQDVPETNHSLVNIISKTPVVMRSGQVAILTTEGSTSFEPGKDYLLIRSNNGFVETSDGDLITTSTIGEVLTVTVDGFALRPESDGNNVRGGYGLEIGGDPGLHGAMVAGTTNVWLGHTLNSLSVAWTGGTAGSEEHPQSGKWENPLGFISLQGGDNDSLDRPHDTRFMPGDKVYIAGADSVTIDLTRVIQQGAGASMAANVSGLVVGKNMEGDTTDTGTYTISDDGGGYGIAARTGIAIGEFVDNGDLLTELEETGKLEKFGDSTLLFANSGANTFTEGIDLYGGTTQFVRANQLGVGAGKAITFTQDVDDADIVKATLEALASVTLTNAVDIDTNFTGDFRAGAGVTFTYTGAMTGTGTLQKTGAGTLILGSDSLFQGAVGVNAGTLNVAADYGDTSGFTVQKNATLAGLGANLTDVPKLGGDGVVETGGTLKPGGLVWSNPSAVPDEHPLTITAGSGGGSGNLAFAANSVFDVRLAEYSIGSTRYSDRVDVAGIVTIDPTATLAVDVDYFKLKLNDVYYTIIAAGSAPINTTIFAFNANDFLPRGVTLVHGWKLDGTPTHYNIGIRYNPADGYSKIPDGTHNETEIGKTIDWIVENQDPRIPDVINHLTGDDDEVLKKLDELSGDLTANALYIALKEPWRHPFNRLDADWPPVATDTEELRRPRLWTEMVGRHTRMDYDGNAHGFTMRRNGFAAGMDALATSSTTVLGGAFRYTHPRLSQATGTVTAHDFEFGLYGQIRLPDGLDLRLYLGYSVQQYDFERIVDLPATPAAPTPLWERLRGTSSGHALAASFELRRPIQLREDFRLTPLLALDYEKAWLNGYWESGGQSALVYDDASMMQLWLRGGLKGEFTARNDRLNLKAWAQYAFQMNKNDYPEVWTRFASVTKPGQPAASIYGARHGRAYLNLGFGLNWRLKDHENVSLYLNYDGKFNNHMRDQAGEAGLMITW